MTELCYSLVVCVNLTEARVLRGRKCLHEIHLSGIFSLSEQWGRAQSMVGGPIASLVVLGSIGR